MRRHVRAVECLVHQIRSRGRVQQGGPLLVERAGTQRHPPGQPVVGKPDPEPDDILQFPHMDLPHRPATGGGQRVEEGQPALPGLRTVRHVDTGQMHRAAVLQGDLRQLTLEHGVADIPGQLEHTRPHIAQNPGQRRHFRPAGHVAGDGPVVDRAMLAQAGRREADGTGSQRRLYLATHGRDVRPARLLGVGPFSHDETAQRGMADVAREVDPFFERVDGIEIVGVRAPGPRHSHQHVLAGDVLGPFDAPDGEVLVGRRRRGDGEAAVPHDGRGDAVERRGIPERIPEDLGVEVRVAVDESRRHEEARGIDLLVTSLLDAPDGGHPPARDPHVGTGARGAGAVDDGAAPDHQVVGHRSPPICCGNSAACSVRTRSGATTARKPARRAVGA